MQKKNNQKTRANKLAPRQGTHAESDALEATVASAQCDKPTKAASPIECDASSHGVKVEESNVPAAGSRPIASNTPTPAESSTKSYATAVTEPSGKFPLAATSIVVPLAADKQKVRPQSFLTFYHMCDV